MTEQKEMSTDECSPYNHDMDIFMTIALCRFTGMKNGRPSERCRREDFKRVGAWWDNAENDPFITEFFGWLLGLAKEDAIRAVEKRYGKQPTRRSS